MDEVYATAGDHMGGKKQPKELDEIRVKKAKSGGHVITHHHKNHPPETHVAKNDKDLIAHMMASVGDKAAPSGDPADAADAPVDAAAPATAPPAAAAGATAPAAAPAAAPAQ